MYVNNMNYSPMHRVIAKFMLDQLGLGAPQSQHFSLPGILTSISKVLRNKDNRLILYY